MAAVRDNKALLEERLLKRCSVIWFLGAGISIPPSEPWEEFVASLAGHVGLDLDDGLDAPKTIVDTCIEYDAAKCDEFLRDALPRHQPYLRTALHHILRLPFKAILTTNFDPYILNHLEPEINSHVFPSLPLTDGIRERVYYLHGLFDSTERSSSISDLVFGTTQFKHAYGKSLLPALLCNVFVYEDVIFTGFDPTEDEIANILEEASEIRREIEDRNPESSFSNRLFALEPVPEDLDEETEESFNARLETLDALGILPVTYDRGGDDYRGLEELLVRWLKEAGMMNRPDPFPTGFEPSTSDESDDV